MEREVDYNIGVRIRRSLADAIRNKASDEFRSFNATLNMLLGQALKKPAIEHLIEEVQKNTAQIELLTSALESMSRQIGGKKK